MPVVWGQVAAMGVMLFVTALAYRRISVAGRLLVVLWVGMLLTVVWVIVAAATHFDARMAFDFPAGAFRLDTRMAMGVGMALTIAMYDYFGYYQVCYLADEVTDASRTIPRSILISVLAVGLMYLAMNVAILGVVPWPDVVASSHIASDLMQLLYGSWAAGLVTMMIVWTALASVFAAMLGYSGIPYAAARAGDFFQAFATLHPTGEFPHRSLLLIGALEALRLPGRLEDGHRCPGGFADSDSVRRSDRDGLLPSIAVERTPGYIPHALLPASGFDRPCRLVTRFRNVRAAGHWIQPGLARSRRGRFPGMGSGREKP